MHRPLIGISLQTITAALTDGLGLPRTSGVIVSDVIPDSPADVAGVQVKDIVATVNGKPVDNVPALALALSVRAAGDIVALGIVRDSQTVSLPITVAERPNAADELSDLADPEKNGIPKLGIIGVDITVTTAAMLSGLRISSGVLVTARESVSPGTEVPLAAGDVIHAVNGVTVRSIDSLRILVDGVKPNSDVILQVERNGQLLFMTCQIY